MQSSSGASVACGDADRERLLHHILASRHFKKSPRLRDFLSYICERSFANRFDEISEQQIAIHIFGRSPDYNAAEDSIVRGSARQLRQKLELYSLNEGANSDWRLTIPKGSYIPLFERNMVAPEAVPEATGKADQPLTVPRWLVKALGAAAVCGLLIWGGVSLMERTDPRAIFWRAVLTSRQATQLVSGDSGLAMLQGLAHHTVDVREYADGRLVPQSSGNFPPAGDPQPATTFVRRRYTSVADLIMAAKTASIAEKLSRKLDLKYARDISLEALKVGNTILVGDPGGNPWVALFSGQLNFEFQIDSTTGNHIIVNHAPSAQEDATYRSYPGDPSHKAYAMIALTHGLDGHSRALLIEGTSVAGTNAAVDFLFDSDRFSDLLKSVIHGWSIDDFEVLLETETVAGNRTIIKIIGFRDHGR